MKHRLPALLFLSLILTGCPPWQTVQGTYTSSEYFEVKVPDGWRRYTHASEELLITYDGVSLQRVSIDRRAIDKDLAHTKKKLAKGMLPQEISEVIVDNIQSNTGISNQQILENTPATIGGVPGFKLIYTYQTNTGLKKQGAYYGFITGDWYYALIYEAPARYYFAKDLPTFEQLKGSFKLLKKSGS